jgi:hypothetical protein
MIHGFVSLFLQLDVSQLSVGDLVWKNRDPALEAQLRASYEGKAASELRKTPVQVWFLVSDAVAWLWGWGWGGRGEGGGAEVHI